MRTSPRDEHGFTMIEVLVVAALIGVVVSAIYSLYLTTLKYGNKQSDITEVQQNLRIAMDSIAGDLRLAGVLVPVTAGPFTAGVLGTYSTSLTINSASPDGVFARITIAKSSSAYANFSAAVASEVPSGTNPTNTSRTDTDVFKSGDQVRIVRPVDNSQPFVNYTCLVVSSLNTARPSVTMTRPGGAAFAAGVNINSGDMIAKEAGTHAYDTILYSLVTNASNSNCPAALPNTPTIQCLERSINGKKPGDIIATNISSMRFSYIDNTASHNETNAPATLPFTIPNILAVRVTLQAGTSATVNTAAGEKSSVRQLSTVVKLRNRRAY